MSETKFVHIVMIMGGIALVLYGLGAPAEVIASESVCIGDTDPVTGECYDDTVNVPDEKPNPIKTPAIAIGVGLVGVGYVLSD